MELHVDDAGFVRATAADCHDLLRDPGGWSTWWSGADLVPVDGAAATWAVRLGGRRRPLRLRLAVVAERPGRGVELACTGDLDGRAEFWLEPGWDGTVVHHVLAASTPRRDPARVLRTYRRWVRAGLWDAKDLLQSRARVAAGLPA